jgi:hypothetical protein
MIRLSIRKKIDHPGKECENDMVGTIDGKDSVGLTPILGLTTSPIVL